VIAAAAAFSALVLAGYWVARRPHVEAEGRLRALGFNSTPVVAGVPNPYGDRVALAGVQSGKAKRSSLLPASLTRRTEERLSRAGLPLTPAAFYAVVLALAVGLPFSAYIILSVALGAGSTTVMTALILCAMIGAYAPFGWLRAKVGSRQSEIRKELPDVLDLLTLCVESGLGLDAAFRRVSEEMAGPMSAEIRQMLHEVDLGKPRRDALEDMASRISLAEVGAVVNATVQSQQMGTSLAQTLRAQTRLLRQRRRQRAEQVARQASVKMAFPLVLFLMPSLFLVILGPIAINLFRALSK
jgi:tight adherence protein C